MARRILWAVAVLLAAAALTAGCFSMKVPEPPPGGYVQLGTSSQPSTAQDRNRVGRMDKKELEAEVLRLTAENDSLRQDIEHQKRENKSLKKEKAQLENRVEDLENQIKNAWKR